MTQLHERIIEILPKLEDATISEDNLLVTYFDAEKNKNISIKLGRLLTKQTSLSEKEVKALVEFQRRKLKGDILMSLTQDAEEIVEFYKLHVAPKGGSNSCMRGEDCVRVYSYDENLFLATFYDGELVDEEFYVGRTLVRTDRMEYIRTYATEQRYHDNIVLTLENAGYSEGDLVGIKLAKEKTSGGFLMPYLDIGGKCVEEYDDYFKVVSYSTSLIADSIDGVLSYGCGCGHCGGRTDEDSCYYTDQEGFVCESCFDDNYVCFEDEIYLQDACTRVIGGTYDGHLVPDELLAEYDYYEPEDDPDYHHIDELTEFNGSWYLTSNCVSLAEETDEGEGYAPKRECTELVFEDVKDLQDWEDTWTLGWYIDERYKDIIEEVTRMLNAQEAGQVDLIDLVEELV